MNPNSPFFTANARAGAPQIGEKDLSILEYRMRAEAFAYRKCSVYSGRFTDPALKDFACAAAQRHSQHFNALETYLDSHR